MIKGIYTAASGMINLLEANDNLANNLANVNTAGFKEGVSIFQSFPEMLIEKMSGGNGSQQLGKLSSGSHLASINFDFKQGSLKETGNKLDFALEGKGFFALDEANGERSYTRNGSFTIDQAGFLCTQEGHRVVGMIDNNERHIQIDPLTKDIAVDSHGNIQADGQPIGRLKIVEFENTKELARKGSSLYEHVGNLPPQEVALPMVHQGHIEQSNSNAIRTMVKTIEGMRRYEMLGKVILTTGQTLEKATTQLGKV